jgi:tRNA threonylcarbamoyladenosine biosynthesis protein TsaE
MRLEGVEATENLGMRLGAMLRLGDVVALYGDLGAGKTSLARGVLRGLGFDGDVASPTFPIVLPYDLPRVPVWHVDLYRIDDPSELDELALDEGLSEAALLIEWPERLGGMLWPEALKLTLQRDGSEARSLTAEVPDAWADRWPPL